MKKFYAFLEKYYPDANKLDGSVVYGYGVAQTMVKVLEMCGDNLTRENVMKQAASLKDFAPDTLLPGVKINTIADRFRPDRAASDDAVQGREVGAVRRHHQRRTQQLTRTYGSRLPTGRRMRPTSVVNAPPMTTKEAAPARFAAGGFLL